MKLTTWAIAVTRDEPDPIDPVRCAADLHVEDKAREDAHRGGQAAAAGPTPTECEIDQFHEALHRSRSRSLVQALDAQHALQAEQCRAFARPDFGAIVQDIEQRAVAMTTAFKAATSELQHEAQMRLADYNVFRHAAHLARQPIEPRSAALHWALVGAFVLVESVANAPFFAAGNVMGLLGGLSVAMCIAALNVLLAARAGVVLRHVNHVAWRIKGLAWSFACLYAAFLLTFHLGVAHWRNALAGLVLNVGPGEAGRAALATLTQMPFSLLTIESWVLVLVGLSFALIALVASYKACDPYPGYSAVAARMRAAAAVLRAHQDGYLMALNAIFEGDGHRGGQAGALARLEGVRQRALDAMTAYRASAAETGRLLQQCRTLPGQVLASRTYCLCRFRAAYLAVAGTLPYRLTAPEPALDLAAGPDVACYAPAPVDEESLREALDAALEARAQQIRVLQRSYLDGAPALFATLELGNADGPLAVGSRRAGPSSGAVACDAAAQAGVAPAARPEDRLARLRARPWLARPGSGGKRA